MGKNSFVEEIIKEWNPTIRRIIATKGFGAIDKGLLENELMEKVYNCIKEYNPALDVRFSTFVNTCLTNHIFVFIRGEKRKKRAFITDAMSLDYVSEDGVSTEETIARVSIEPEIDFKIILDQVLEILPEYLKAILLLLYDGYSETEIALEMKMDTELVKGYIQECLRPRMREMLGMETL